MDSCKKKEKKENKNTALLRLNTHPTVAGPAGLNVMSGRKWREMIQNNSQIDDKDLLYGCGCIALAEVMKAIRVRESLA